MGHVAVVTGAASGIGLASAQELLRRDPATVVVGVDRDDRPNVLGEIDRVLWVQGDVTAQATWDAVQDVCAKRDPLGAASLVACAADIVIAPFLETGVDDWRRLFDINVLGVVRGMQTLMPAMLERGRGAIAVTCSIVSLYAADQVSAYATSKAALLHVVRSAALEYARKGIRINAVCPGFVDTRLLQRHLESLDDPVGARRAAERRSPNGRLLTPEEIATTLCFLLSEEASGLSGAAVMIDGGLTTTFDFDSSAS